VSPGARGLAGSLCFLFFACELEPVDETGKRCSQDRPCGGDLVCVGGRCQRADGRGDGGEPPDTGGDAGAGGDGGGPRDGGGDAGAGADGGGPLDGGGASDAGAGRDGGASGNLLQNPGFEVWDGGLPSDWILVRGVLTRSDAARSGLFAARFGVVQADGGSPDGGQLLSSRTTITSPGERFCGRVYAQLGGDAGVDFVVRERVRDAGGTSPGSELTTSCRVDDGGWVLLAHCLSTSLGPGALVELRVNLTGPVTGSVLLDDATLGRVAPDAGPCGFD
jgi:hypothetical protein